jgi:hypothetical protein
LLAQEKMFDHGWGQPDSQVLLKSRADLGRQGDCPSPLPVMATDRDGPTFFRWPKVGHPQIDKFPYLEAGVKHQKNDGQ